MARSTMMNKPSPTPKRRFRFRFSLLTFLVLFSVIGVGAGVWMAWVEPVRDQWAAVKPLLDRGANVQTSPSKLPGWMKSVLPTGQTENIADLFFNYTKKLKSDDLKCLARLPHLKRLYLEQSGLDDAGVAWVADCPTIELLSVGDNYSISNKSVETLASLPNLTTLNIESTGMNWRAMTEFQKKPQLLVAQNFRFSDAQNSELETMAEIDNTNRALTVSGSDETTIPRAIRLFPNLVHLRIDKIESLKSFNIDLLEPHSTPMPDGHTIDRFAADHEQTLPRGKVIVELDNFVSYQTGIDEAWWRALLRNLDVSGLDCSGKFLSVYFSLKDLDVGLELQFTGVSPENVSLLNEMGGLATTKWSRIWDPKNSLEFESLDFLSWFSELESLEMFHCFKLKRFDFQLLSPKIKSVHLENCTKLTEIVNLFDLPELENVEISQCPATIQNIDLPASTKLTISSPRPEEIVVGFNFLKDVRSLGNLKLHNCNGLEDLGGIEDISGLKKLEIFYCQQLYDRTALFKCRELRELSFQIGPSNAQTLTPPDHNFLTQLDKFSFDKDSMAINQTWTNAWNKIVESRETNDGSSD